MVMAGRQTDVFQDEPWDVSNHHHEPNRQCSAPYEGPIVSTRTTHTQKFQKKNF